MRVLILGATGAIGILLIRQVLKQYQSCTVVLYVRSPEKVLDDLKANPAIVVIEGQLNNKDALTKAAKGVDVVLSALGPIVKRGPFHPSNTPLANAYLGLIEIMHQQHIKRLICLGTVSMTDPADKFSLAHSAMVSGVALFARNAYNDVVAIANNIRSHGADLDWTIVRVPILTDSESEDVIAGYIGDGKTGTLLARAGFAAFAVGEIAKKEWVKKAPLISSL
ncbi:putative NAD(P)H-binding [Lyophyllum shimeji]|uniref:NAD(P)H-binding n=1 Tax=Lyophyllum shimeji TaxID=47721 RepID=A0A9P3PIQ6_LYOSH|nr:putative NAD(P)H-binding [Lyophyllum shimeji]